MAHYSTEPRMRKYVKGYGLLSFARKYKNQFLDTGIDSLQSASKKVVHETGEFLGNKNAYAVTNLHIDKILKTKPVEEIIIQPEKRRNSK